MLRPKYLYKYRSFNVNTLRLLDQAEIYYAPPTSFNDPLDCKPTLQVDVDLRDVECLLFKMLAPSVGREKASEAIGNHRHMSSEYGDYKAGGDATREYVRRMASDINNLLAKELSNCGVLALASEWNCPLMWSHYADEHRGICVEFETSDSKFHDLRPVSYDAPRAIKVSDVIEWKLRRNVEAKERISRTFFFSKAGQWKYENEWRDLALAPGVKPVPARISSIYFGLRCDYTVISAVVRLFVNARYPVKFYRIYPKDESFKLDRYLVDNGEIEAMGVREPDFLVLRDFFVDMQDG